MDLIHISEGISGFLGSALGAPTCDDVRRNFARGKFGDVDINGVVTTIDKEDRKREFRTDAPPFRMICSIEVAFGDEPPVPAGTGWLVGRCTVVTAAHVLWWDGKVKKVRVVPGRNGLDPGRRGFESTTFHIHEQWGGETQQRPEWDIAAIRLPEPIGDTIGWFGVAAMPDNMLADRMVNIAGYPSVVDGQMVERCAEFWFETNFVAEVRPERLFYGIDTSPGQSGAPIILWPNPLAPDGPPTVIGVHTRGVTDEPLNSGTRINGDKLALLGGWVASDNAAI